MQSVVLCYGSTSKLIQELNKDPPSVKKKKKNSVLYPQDLSYSKYSINVSLEGTRLAICPNEQEPSREWRCSKVEWVTNDFLRARSCQHPSLHPPGRYCAWRGHSSLTQAIPLGCVQFPNLCVLRQKWFLIQLKTVLSKDTGPSSRKWPAALTNWGTSPSPLGQETKRRKNQEHWTDVKWACSGKSDVNTLVWQE